MNSEAIFKQLLRDWVNNSKKNPYSKRIISPSNAAYKRLLQKYIDRFGPFSENQKAKLKLWAQNPDFDPENKGRKISNEKYNQYVKQFHKVIDATQPNLAKMQWDVNDEELLLARWKINKTVNPKTGRKISPQGAIYKKYEAQDKKMKMCSIPNNVWKFLGTKFQRYALPYVQEQKDYGYTDEDNQWLWLLNWAKNDLARDGLLPDVDTDVRDDVPCYIYDLSRMEFEVDKKSTVPQLVQYGREYEKFLQNKKHLEFRKQKSKTEEAKLLRFCRLLKNGKYEEAQAMDIDF